MNIPEEGSLLLVNKPKSWTSFDVVNKLRYLLKIKKIGHAGTLDPLATGLLLIGVGKYTKKLESLHGLDKTYEGIIEIGKTTPSFDLETPFDSSSDYMHVTPQEIASAREALTGELDQMPPIYSAIKVNGQRAYKSARKNEIIELKSRKIKVYKFEIIQVILPEIYFRVVCSKGTYIRSLANEFGEKLGVGGYLKELVRTQVGDYKLENAFKLKQLVDQINLINESN
ncbi:MAG: tRNA pseudouridine(55) synthase TruB [Flammeovirgaceae bacterium]|nr:tRNA pseudouridine(55) synthase TruB [Flammeovirgaceae bacterium]|tara:strand:+ start:2669 stop:3349 length:681 start_codon:yes stop_codon:yes gene_type:complete